MNILSVEEKGDMIEVTTNNPNRPVFVYPKDKFKGFDDLKTEIKKSIKLEKVRKDKKLKKLNKIKSDMIFLKIGDDV